MGFQTLDRPELIDQSHVLASICECAHTRTHTFRRAKQHFAKSARAPTSESCGGPLGRSVQRHAEGWPAGVRGCFPTLPARLFWLSGMDGARSHCSTCACVLGPGICRGGRRAGRLVRVSRPLGLALPCLIMCMCACACARLSNTPRGAQAFILVMTGYFQLRHLRQFFEAKKLV